jgi:hypothetical protein
METEASCKHHLLKVKLEGYNLKLSVLFPQVEALMPIHLPFGRDGGRGEFKK